MRATVPGPNTLLALAALALGLALALPAAAYAVDVQAPADTLGVPDVVVRTGPAEGPGLGVLLVDGAALRTAVLRPSTTVTFTALPLAPGAHTLRVALRSRLGTVFSPAVVVRCWQRPAAPAVALPAENAIVPRTLSLNVRAGSSTSRLSLVVNDKVAAWRAVSAGSLVTLSAVLPAGRDSVCVVAENPVAATALGRTVVRLGWPVPGYVNWGSGFGMRNGRMHRGIDIHAPFGTKVVASADGSVRYAQALTTFGKLAVVDYGGGVTCLYAHLNGFAVKKGQRVTKGQVIAYVGSTAASTPHLHFEVHTNVLPVGRGAYADDIGITGTPVDPAKWVVP